MSKHKTFPELTQALSALSWSHPFWSTLLYEQLQIIITEAVETLAVGGAKLYINQSYFCGPKFDSNNRVFMIAHEIAHEMLFHPHFMAEYKDSGFEGEPFDLMRFNMAADYVNNDMLIDMRVGQYHPDWLHSPHFKWRTDNVFDVYKRLKPKNPPPPPPSGGGGQGEGQGNGQSPADPDGNEPSGENGQQPTQYDILDKDGNVVGETPEGAKPQDEHKFGDEGQHTKEDWKQAVAGAHQQAKSMGSGSASLDRMVEEYLAPERDWASELRDYVTARRGRETRNYRRLHKRKLYERGIPMPTKYSYQMEDLLIIHDVSGSVSNDEHMLCKGTCVDIFTQCRPRAMRVLCVASHVTDDQELDSVEEYMDWQPKGTGGTDMEAGFRYALEDGFMPQLCIVLTDGWTGFSDPPPFPVVWLSTDKEVEEYPYGKAIKLGDD